MDSHGYPRDALHIPYSPPPLCFSARFRDVGCSQRVPRLAKEQKLYAQENQDQKLKLDKLVANSPDEWETKNGVRHYCLQIGRAHV